MVSDKCNKGHQSCDYIDFQNLVNPLTISRTKHETRGGSVHKYRTQNVTIAKKSTYRIQVTFFFSKL